MLRVVPAAAELPDPAGIQALLITSGNAVPHIPASFRDVRLLAVGDSTAEHARRAGFTAVISAGADAAALALLARSACDPAAGPLLLAGAAGQGEPLATALDEAGFEVLRHAVYQAQPVEELPPVAIADLVGNRIAACMFFSPATARAFIPAFMRACSVEMVFTIDALAISKEAASALAPLPWRRIRVARRPTQDELLALLP
jgi:uroporphyrinogen-III synthase